MSEELKPEDIAWQKYDEIVGPVYGADNSVGWHDCQAAYMQGYRDATQTPCAAGVVEALETLIREYDRQTDKGAAPVLTNAQRSARAELKAYKERLEN